MSQALFILFLTLWGSCTYLWTKQSPSRSGLTVALPFDPNGSLFPPAPSSITTILVRHLYEGLTCVNEQGEVELALADGMHVSDDETTYTFSLRNRFWSDGSPLTSFDLEQGWKDILLQFGPEGCPQVMKLITGVTDFLNNRIPWDQVGIKATQPDQFQVSLNEPDPAFPRVLSLPFLVPRDPTLGQEKNNGPFFIKSWHPGNLVLKRNPFYPRAHQVHLDEVSILFLRDEKLSFSLLEQGQIDLAVFYDQVKPSRQLIRAEPYLLHVIGQSGLTAAILFNRKKQPLHHLQIRQALSLAIKREALLEQHSHLNFPAYQLIPPVLAKKEKENTEPYHKRKEKAKELLEGAIRELHLSTDDFDGLNILALEEGPPFIVRQIIRKTWIKSLGVSLPIEQPPFEQGIQQLLSGDFNIALLFYQSSCPENDSFLEPFLHGHLHHLLTPEEKVRFLSEELSIEEMEQTLLDNYIVIPLYHPGYLCGTRLGLKGVNIDPFFQDIDFSRAYWERTNSFASG
ncbi:Oligopeptide ABC transporter, periplasmic oligopeptide-binding protein OppA [Candidatus Similichlamydia laticola]|uniref:Oligopeptide ABC transporter, periplasmic oligopeptide-binding protein OppA n=1 Tax=Candidatus Similichlamydia laticola TaxID=2170265 RepID=A0A369KDP2_9BACT|nr:Oligopeptide ABC transporter, periplasmic oligopeptide-binding protein OppA [Candidatus Similichlamydia laticola]